MQNFMIELLTASLVMSVIALFYMTATPLLSKRYAAKGRYYLWLVVVIGLIIPFRPQLGDALITIDIPADATPIMVQTDLKGALHTGIVLQDVSESHARHAPQTGSTHVESTPQTNNPYTYGESLISTPSVALVENTSPMPRPLTLWQISMVIWLAGAVNFLIYHMARHYRFMKIIKRWSEPIADHQTIDILQKLKSDMGIRKHISIYQCSSIGSPMLTGFIRPRILLPNMSFAASELKFILTHELIHYKRKDLYYSVLVLITNAIHWFNPVVYVMARSIYALCEISCDAEVVKSSDTDARLRYSETIIGVAGYKSRLKTAFSTNFNGGKKGMKNRISSIMDTRKKRMGVVVLCMLLAITLCAGLIFATNSTSLNYDNDEPQADASYPETQPVYGMALGQEDLEPHGFSAVEVIQPGVTVQPDRVNASANIFSLADSANAHERIVEERVMSYVFDASSFRHVDAELFATPLHIRTHQQDYILVVFDVVPEFEVGIRPQFEFNDQTGVLHITQEPCDTAVISGWGWSFSSFENVFGNATGNHVYGRTVNIRNYASMSLAPPLAPNNELIISEWQIVDGVDFGLMPDVTFYDVGLFTVYVPEGSSIDLLNINATIGTTRVFGDNTLSIDNAVVGVSNGTALFRDLYLRDIDATAQSGSISLMGVTFSGHGNFSAQSGNVSFTNDSQVNGVIHAQARSGSVFLRNTLITGSVYAEVSSGSVFVADSQIFGSLNPRASSGSVFINDSRFYVDLTVEASSGSVFWDNVQANRMATARVSSGSIFITGGSFADVLTTDARSGSIWWDGVSAAQDAYATVTSGMVTLTNSRVRGRLTASTTTGGIFLTAVDTDMDAANISYGRHSTVMIR